MNENALELVLEAAGGREALVAMTEASEENMPKLVGARFSRSAKGPTAAGAETGAVRDIGFDSCTNGNGEACGSGA
jgi:hypothetical protein